MSNPKGRLALFYKLITSAYITRVCLCRLQKLSPTGRPNLRHSLFISGALSSDDSVSTGDAFSSAGDAQRLNAAEGSFSQNSAQGHHFIYLPKQFSKGNHVQGDSLSDLSTTFLGRTDHNPVEMVYQKSKHKLNKSHDNILHPPSTNNIFKTLISALESHKDIKSQHLKSSYYLLIQLSSKHQLSLGKGSDLNELLMKTNEGEVRVSLRDLYTLSNILFKNLQKRLKQLELWKHDALTSQSLELQELNLLIRCCIVTLTFPLPQQHLLEKGRFFLVMFKKLCLLETCHKSIDFKSLDSCQCMYIGANSSNSFAEVASLSSLDLFDPCIPSITTLLEVVIDELLVNERVRKYFHLINSFFSPKNGRLFNHDPNGGNFGILMEMIYSHFSLSISNEERLLEFLEKLTWARFNSPKSCELSITTCKILLQSPVFLSSPKLLQAHIVSLVSNIINLNIITKTPPRDPTLIHHYLSVLETSVSMYTQHMSVLKTENHPKGNLVILPKDPCFGPCTKRHKVEETVNTLNELWNSKLRKNFFKKKLDLLASSIEYIDENAPRVLDIPSCQDEVISFLKCMVTRAANDDNDPELPLSGDASLQDICLLASLLMLMSKSIWCVKGPTPMEYDFILGIIKCFKEFDIRLPIQKFSYNNITGSCKESRLMLIHFLGLLSLSFDSGLDFLVKSCISLIMALTNLIVFEDGNIDALNLLANPHERSNEKPLVVAAKFQKIRTLYLSNGATSAKGLVVGGMEERGTCSGEVYLKTRLVGSGKVSDFDDLADFVECKKGKDYVGWLKDRDNFRRGKIGKRSKRLLDKKKQVWRSMADRVSLKKS
ncbi:hypothetical protein LXL04_028265 [Taraxacum kok-saghyz]